MPLPGWPVMAPNAYDNNNNWDYTSLPVGQYQITLLDDRCTQG